MSAHQRVTERHAVSSVYPYDELHGLPRLARRLLTFVLGATAVLALIAATVLFFAGMAISSVVAAVVFVLAAWGSERVNTWGRHGEP